MRVLVVLCLAACAAAPPAVNVTAGWPDKPLSYEEAHARWTRRARASGDFMQIIDAAATLGSPEWRAAYAAERARRHALRPEDAAALAATERTAAEAEWEVVLVVQTAKPAWNDFNKPQRSMWRVALAGDEGREVTPASIVEDKRPRAVIEQFFPDMTPFHRAYLVRFPRTAADGRPLVGGDASRLVLKIASAVGHVEMAWGH